MIIRNVICLLVLFASFAGCADTNTPLVGRHRAMFAQQKGNWEQAIEIRKELIVQFPDYTFLPDIHFEQAEAYVQQNQNEKAIESFDEAIKLDPEFQNAFVSRCNVHFQMGNFQQAISDSDQAIAIGGDEDLNLNGLYLIRGDAYAETGDLSRAIFSWEIATLLAPKALAPKLRIVAGQAEIGQLDRALKLVDEILQHNELNPEVHFHRCQVLAIMNRKQEAQTALDAARKLDLEGLLKLPSSVDQIISANKQAQPKTKQPKTDHLAEKVEEAAKLTPMPASLHGVEVDHAISIAKKFLKDQGFELLDQKIDLTNAIHCKEKNQEYQILVKVMKKEAGRNFELSDRERDQVLSQSMPTGMILVSEIEFDPQTGTLNLESGRVSAFAKNWEPKLSRLKPKTYQYELPEKP